MKLFAANSNSNQPNKTFKYKGSYTFRVISNEINDTIQLNNSKEMEVLYSLDKDNFLTDYCLPSIKMTNNEAYGITFEPFTCFYPTVTPQKKKTKFIKLQSKSHKLKKNQYNIGRWTEDEHRRFIEAILKYGNEWKSVQRHIKTRSSTQSRSHSQKFFLKIKNYDIFDFKDKKPCISSLNELAKTLSEKERENMLELLISYEYSDMPERMDSFAKKKTFDLSLEFEEDDLANLQFSTSSASNNYTMRKSNNIILVNEDKEMKDEFQDQFVNAFINNKRKHSFEDNVLMFCKDNFKCYETRRSSIKQTKRRISEDNFVDSLIQFNNGYIII